MKIPRRLKEITPVSISISHEKRSFLLTHKDGRTMIVDVGQVVSLEQWAELARAIKRFAKKPPILSLDIRK